MRFLCENTEWTASNVSHKEVFKYTINRENAGELCHPYMQRFEKSIITGQSSMRECIKMSQNNYRPDLIIGHSGFGSTIYLKELWPTAKFIGYFEWFYKSRGSDVHFGINEPISPDLACRVHTYNAPILMDMAICDAGIVPTEWQYKQFPDRLKNNLSVIYDGIDTDFFKPKESIHDEYFEIGKEKIPVDIPLVTYTTRCFEQYRGWPQVAKGISLIMQRNPQVHVLIVGSDEVAYGNRRSDGQSWRQWAYNEYRYDETRLHFSPPLQYNDYLKVLQNSWVHIYWTIPFILSWSLAEAMSTECCIVASNTEPVKEFIETGKEGVLVDFFDSDAMANSVDILLKDEELRRRFGKMARKKIIDEEYDIKSSISKQIELIHEIAGI